MSKRKKGKGYTVRKSFVDRRRRPEENRTGSPEVPK